MKKKKVFLYSCELADTYALKTLYDYLKPKAEKFKMFFLKNHNFSSREQEFLPKSRIRIMPQNNSLYIRCHSDISDGEYSNSNGDTSSKSLGIDIAILKNCVTPLTKRQKISLKKKYQVPLNKPITVVSYIGGYGYIVKQIAKTLWEDSMIYFMTSERNMSELQLPPQAKTKVKFIPLKGILKDYYAMADVALNGSNFEMSWRHMHNFVEATEGGPLFMVPPVKNRRNQYGYKELVKRKVIIKCRNLDDILEKVSKKYRESPSNKEHVAQRSEHLNKTRETYLPVIHSHILKLLGLRKRALGSNLKIRKFKKNKIRLSHPDTQW